MESGSMYESEKVLEDNLIKQLIADGYEFVEINDVNDLHDNFRNQINKHNEQRLKGHKLSDKEFEDSWSRYREKAYMVVLKL